MIIQTQDQLDSLCEKLSQNAYLTIDTEFLRDKTYYSILCLVQLAGPDVDAAAIDPVETDLDLSAFHALMQNKDIVKVFHAARQDLEIFWHDYGYLPAPIFDTQVAAMVSGHGDQIAYNALVKNITGAHIEKNAQFTDWSRRPLTQKQITYALGDVTHLRDVYETLSAQLDQKGRKSWVFEEMEILTSESTYKVVPDECWQRIKIRTDKPDILAILQKLAAWRETQAQERNVPKNRILRDDTLADLAMYKPTSADGLSRIRSLPKDLAKGRMGKTLLDVIGDAKNTPKDALPQKQKRTPMPPQAQATLEMLKLLLKINCGQSGVATKLVATKDDLEALATTQKPDIPTLKGWRREIFGQDALALKSGKLALAIENDEIKLVEL